MILPEHRAAFGQVVLEVQEKRTGGRIRRKDVLEFMQTKYGVNPTGKTVYNTGKRSDLVWITVHSIYPQADQAAQEDFKKIMIEGGRNSVDIWFQDEARGEQRGTVTRTWAKKGTRPSLARQQQMLMSLEPHVPPEMKRLDLCRQSQIVSNPEAMWMHVEHISMKIPSGRHAVIALDKTPGHTSKGYYNSHSYFL